MGSKVGGCLYTTCNSRKHTRKHTISSINVKQINKFLLMLYKRKSYTQFY